jgi:outer membrane protein OmpU
MKRAALLGSTALLGAGMMSSTAMAADGIKLALGGFFNTAYMATFDDDSEGELGNDRATDGVFTDAEIHFTGSTALDNGLEVGAHVELEGEDNTTNPGNDQIDEAWIYFSGGFGELRVGALDDALVGSCILPPGGTANFSAFSPNQWGANTDVFAANFPAFTSNAACISVDDREDAQKLVYFTPSFGGFQLALSYTPNGGDERQGDGVGPHLGMPFNEDEESRHNFAAYGSYTYEGDGWGLTAGAGGSFEGQVEQSPGPNRDEQQFYQAGLNLTFGQFAVGGTVEYYNNLVAFSGGDETDAWVAGGGFAYTLDAWTLGAQYSHQLADTDVSGGGDRDFAMDRAVLTANYALGPSIDIDGEVGYTWLDTDPETDDHVDDYQALEIGIGTAITF